MHKDVKIVHEITDMLPEAIFRAKEAANSVLKRPCDLHSLTKNPRYFLVTPKNGLKFEMALYNCSPSNQCSKKT